MGKKKKRILRHLPPDFDDVIRPEEFLGGEKPRPYPPPSPPPPPPPPDHLWYEIAFYGTYLFSSRPHADLGSDQALAVISLYSDVNYVGAISFYADGEQLPEPELLFRQLTGVWVIGLNYHISRYADIMAMLRAEPHVFVYYSGPYNSVISTVFPADYYG